MSLGEDLEGAGRWGLIGDVMVRMRRGRETGGRCVGDG